MSASSRGKSSKWCMEYLPSSVSSPYSHLSYPDKTKTLEHPGLHHLLATGRFNSPFSRNKSPYCMGLPAVTNISPTLRLPRLCVHTPCTQQYRVLGHIPVGLPGTHGACCVVYLPGARKNWRSHCCVLEPSRSPWVFLWWSRCVGRTHVVENDLSQTSLNLYL